MGIGDGSVEAVDVGTELGVGPLEPETEEQSPVNGWRELVERARDGEGGRLDSGPEP